MAEAQFHFFNVAWELGTVELRLVDQMAVAGIVGEHKGSVAREILISLEDWDEMQQLEADEDSDLE